MKKHVTRRTDNKEGIVTDLENGFEVTYNDGEVQIFNTYSTLKKKHFIGKAIEENNNEEENNMNLDEQNESLKQGEQIETEQQSGDNNLGEGNDQQETGDSQTSGNEDGGDDEGGESFDYNLKGGSHVYLMSFDRLPDRKGNLTKSEIDVCIEANDKKYFLDMVNGTDGSFAMILLSDANHEPVYKSPKWSIKDTCQWLGKQAGLTDEHVEEMTQVIQSMRKTLKKQAKAQAE